jgi:ferredoxin--NADP+ reductase
MNRPLRVAVVGAGPAGMYAAGHLLEGPAGTYLDGRLRHIVDMPVEVDVFDALPTQWGLLRHGVAPDHPEKKLVQRIFEQNAARPGFRFYGNVEIGNDVHSGELADWYDAVVYAHGAAGDNRLGVPGEDLPGSLSARAFVAWYNGHPDYRDLEVDLSCERVVVVGNGNVALDVARILAAPVAALSATDVAEHARAALADSGVREIVVLGRRTCGHAAFHNPELEELAHLTDVDIIVEAGEPDIVPGDREHDRDTRRKVATLRRYAARPVSGSSRRIVLRFLGAPVAVVGHARVEGLLVARNDVERDDTGRATVRPARGDAELLETGLVLRAVGYFGIPMPGLPYDDQRGIVPNAGGRVLSDGRPVPGRYVTGWAKRGPRGIIGANKKCARDTVLALIDDARADRLPRAGTLTAEAVHAILRDRCPGAVDQAGWLRIDDRERRAGRAGGRPRVKLADRPALLAAAGREGFSPGG